MKKLIKYVMCGLIAAMILTGCSKTSDNGGDESLNTEIGDNTETSAAEDAHNHMDDLEDSEVSIEDADISEGEAVERIKSYSIEELGLDSKSDYDDYKFMVATTGKTVDGVNYMEVIASVVTDENDDGTISMETKGTYLISYDGREVLVVDNETGEISEM